MLMTEFVEPYPRTLGAYADYEYRRTMDATNEETGRMWSHRFGVVLHDGMTGRESHEQFLDEVPKYMQWNGSVVAEQTHLFDTPADKLEARNESNFHALNRGMIFLWEPFISGWKSEHGRKLTLQYAEHALALEGFKYYLGREQYIKDAGGVHALYAKEASDFLVSTAGVMLEFDVALTAIDILKNHPDFAKHSATVIPAPAQFERNHKPRNVDFVVADHTTERAVGLQSKLRITPKDIEITDHERVVLIDGSIDLDNVLALRTEKGSSKTTVRAWPGIIAAKKVLEIKTKGKGRSPFIYQLEQEVPTAELAAARSHEARRVAHKNLSFKMSVLAGIHEMQRQAKLLTGHIALDQAKIRERIGSRILEKL